MSIAADGNRPASPELGAVLQRFRRAAGLSQERLAARCAMSQSKVSRIERGKELPSVGDVERMVKALEVPDELAVRLVTVARRANVAHVSGRALAELGLWRAQTEIKHIIELCGVQRSFLPVMIGGLFQTPEYARAALTPTLPTSPVRDVEKAVAARLDQQTVLEYPTRQFHVLLTEQAVRWKRIGRPGMVRQCEHLVALAERPNIHVGVVPLTAGVPAAPLNSFHVYDERLVMVELFSGRVDYREHKDVQYHLDLFEFFRGYALTGDRARAFLLSARDEFM
ncbi:transcriptional regulator with XRE-family HTH domain [Amycolatopsis endophytica]|uniref:Transcriptional regulator with XRE-family HTH domain n=1 Tax=Amycolatopsis endophytica TaxID=860233 RepID=A0A853AZH1_9PSEU|nr:helix-turn-helix transcriptional regulator [Amycolatopsis endophytica]NYI87951.1 transcriptional regulator with XRE-family HTH domain [Amycolatopsis endophytica]